MFSTNEHEWCYNPMRDNLRREPPASLYMHFLTGGGALTLLVAGTFVVTSQWDCFPARPGYVLRGLRHDVCNINERSSRACITRQHANNFWCCFCLSYFLVLLPDELAAAAASLNIFTAVTGTTIVGYGHGFFITLQTATDFGPSFYFLQLLFSVTLEECLHAVSMRMPTRLSKVS